MFEKMKEVLEERIRNADDNPLYCPTCNAPRHSADLIREDNFNLVCGRCSASVCTAMEGLRGSFTLHETSMPSKEALALSPNRTMP